MVSAQTPAPATAAVIASRAVKTSPFKQFLGGLAHRWLRIGLVGVILIVLGSHTPAYLPQNSPWWPLMRALYLDGPVGKIGGTATVLLGLALLIQAWLKIRLVVVAHLPFWVVLVWWCLPLLFSPPTFSHDAYSYAAQGWLSENGLNPYEVGVGSLPGAFADQAPWEWRTTPTPYGPLALVMQHGLVMLSGNAPYVAALLQRLPAVLGVALIAIFLPKIAARTGVNPDDAAWLAVLNPLLLLDFVGGAHNDAQMTGLVVLGIWLAYRYHWLWGAVVVGVAVSIKQPALLAALALPFAVYRVRAWTWPRLWQSITKVAVSVLVAGGTFVGISFATGYNFGWLNALNVPGSVMTVSPFTLIGQVLQFIVDFLGLDPTGHNAIRYSRTAGMVVSVLVVGWLALTLLTRKPMRFLSWSYLTFALCGPALHGWYMLWGGVLLPLSKPTRAIVRYWTWATVVLLAYAAVNLSWRNGSVALGIAGISLLGWVVAHHHRRSDRMTS